MKRKNKMKFFYFVTVSLLLLIGSEAHNGHHRDGDREGSLMKKKSHNLRHFISHSQDGHGHVHNSHKNSHGKHSSDESASADKSSDGEDSSDESTSADISSDVEVQQGHQAAAAVVVGSSDSTADVEVPADESLSV